jgi:glycosyltransferase involved in cell wall biosynthesis
MSATSRNGDITVVITCFNYGAYLPEAVASAIEQDGGPPKVMVVDDGSTDVATQRVLDQLPPEVTVIRQANSGLSAARNAGLRASHTPYLIVLDADDRLALDALTLLRAPLNQNPQLGFSYGVTQFIGHWEGTLTFPPFDPYKLLFRHIIGATALMRRELFEEIGGFDPGFSRYEDWEFWVHALAHGWRGGKVNAVTLFYRRHGHTMNADARANYRMWFRRLRQKHSELYGRTGRSRLAAESDLGPAGRAVYRWWWGARPVPARLEALLHSLIWRAGSRPAT